MNARWHAAHPMPSKPTLEQRIKWDLSHQKQCSCRPIPQKLADEIRRRAR